MARAHIIFLHLFLLSFYSFSQSLPAIPGLKLWLRSDSGLVLSSGNVQRWNDISGAGNAAVQLTPANQPLFTDSIPSLNYKPVIRFDGTNDALSLDSLCDIGTLFIVCNWNGASTFPMYNGLINKATAGFPKYLFIGNAASTSFFTGPPTLFNTSVFVNTLPSTNFGPLADYKILSGDATAVAAQYDLIIGNNLFDGGNNTWNGDIAEVIIYDNVLSSVQRQQVEVYLQDKYAPPVNLGADINVSYGFCPVTLNAGARFKSFLWSTGAVSQAIPAPGAGKYWVRVTDIFGRQSSDTINITYPLNQIPNNQTFCLGDSILWNTGLSSTEYTFNWNTAATTPSIYITQQGQYHVTVTDSFLCAFNSDTITALTDSFPVAATLGNDTALCTGNSIGLITEAAKAQSYLWSTSAISPTIPIPSAGAYWVQVTDTNGCVKKDTINITIKGTAPTANFSYSQTCVGDTMLFSDSSTPVGGDNISSWLWNFGDGATSSIQHPEHKYNNDSTYSVTLVLNAQSGCSGTASQPVLVDPLPVVSFSIPTTCEGTPALYTNLSSIPSGSITTWLWNFGDTASGINNTSSLPDPLHTFTTQGEYTIKLIATSNKGCTDSISRFLKVNTNTACFVPDNLSGLQLWLSADSGIVLNGTTVTQWTDRSGNSNNAVAGGSNEPLFVSSVTQLNDQPVIQFDGVDDLLNINSSLTIGTAFIISNWRGGGSVFPNYNGLVTRTTVGPPHYIFTVEAATSQFYAASPATLFQSNLYKNTSLSLDYSPLSDYKIIAAIANTPDLFPGLVVGDNPLDGGVCNWNGDIAEIIIYDTPLSSSQRQQVESYLRYKYAPPVNLGADINVSYGFCPVTLDAGARFKSFLWSTGATSQTISAAKSGKYWVTATDIFGFQSSDTINITYPLNQILNNQTFCLGDSILWNTGLSSAEYTFNWNTAATTPSIYITQQGQYHVTVTDSFLCAFNSDTITALTDSFPVAATLGNDTALCTGNSIGLITEAAKAQSYLWSTSAISPTIPIPSAGAYWVQVTDTNGCVKKDTINITIKGTAPVASFSGSTTCVKDSTSFTDSSTPALGDNILSWLWDFGDGSTSSDQHPEHLFANDSVYNVKLTINAASGCSENLTQSVTVHPLPVAWFNMPTACSGAAIPFTDASAITSGAITSWLWNFGDTASGGNNTASIPNPSHTFVNSGIYQVKLKTTSGFGCEDSATRTMVVNYTPAANFGYAPTCEGSYMKFTDLSSGGFPSNIQSWKWEFGDYIKSNQQNPSHLYLAPGTYTVTLTITSTAGCTSSVIKPVILSTKPKAGFPNLPGCENTPYLLSDTSTVASSSISAWKWYNAGTLISSFKNTSYLFADTGSYTVSLVVSTPEGCSDSVAKKITINTSPETKFTFSPLFGPPPLNVAFSNQSTNATTYSWMFGDAGTSSLLAPLHTYSDTGTYSIKLVSSNTFGCNDSLSKTIKVLVPVTDLAVRSINCTQQPGKVLVTANLVNYGTVDIYEFDLNSEAGLNSRISEHFTITIPPGADTTVALKASFETSTGNPLDYVCVTAENPNNTTDAVPSNNRQCKALSEDFIAPLPYPNPTTENLTVQFILTKNADVNIELYNARGKKVKNIFSSQGSKGLNRIDLYTGDLAAGLYVLKYVYADQISYRKFIKE